MRKYIDSENYRLVCIDKGSTAEYWDAQWMKMPLEKLYPENNSPFDDVVLLTKKYLASESLIMEGGCGTGRQVHKLQVAGFKVVGIDYAPQIIEAVKKMQPSLDIRKGDVTQLDFESNMFDAYWSFGVIEHFYNGYEQVISEMFRVLKPGGYLFISFPYLSKLRKLKIKLNSYPLWQESADEVKKFYQFILDEKKVLVDLEKNGFRVIQTQHISGIKGLKDEIIWLRKPLQKIFDNQWIIFRILSRLISMAMSRFSAHSVRFTLKKL
jgi:ubiquinone/menaquinone biosynthesis C-methylase UbiE